MNELVLDVVYKFSFVGKLIVFICYGQLVLVVVDCVKGRKCTVYFFVKFVFIVVGVNWVEVENMEVCVVDGNLIIGVVYTGYFEFI